MKCQWHMAPDAKFMVSYFQHHCFHSTK